MFAQFRPFLLSLLICSPTWFLEKTYADPAAKIEGLTPPQAHAWLDYLATIPLEKLQADCMPQIVPAQGTYRGVVTLYHGFSACPQQYNTLSQRLSELGFTVVLPLNPGHGRRWTLDAAGKKVDDFSAIPTGVLSDSLSYRHVYGDFVAAMNRVAATFPGERIVGGISLGAVFALAATVESPQLWDRQLILSPLLESDSDPIRILTHLVAYNPQAVKLLGPLLEKVSGWGEGCEKERDPSYVFGFGREETRAGICQFKFTNALATGLFGYETFQTLKPTHVQTQYIAVQADSLIDKNALYRSVARLRAEPPALAPELNLFRRHDDQLVRICRLPNDKDTCKANAALPLAQQAAPCINHSLISRYDTPAENKYWIAPLEEKIVDFIADGLFLPQDSENLIEGDPVCLDFPRL